MKVRVMYKFCDDVKVQVMYKFCDDVRHSKVEIYENKLAKYCYVYKLLRKKVCKSVNIKFKSTVFSLCFIQQVFKEKN